MLAFLDSPVALIALLVGALVLFGPNKLPEIAGQLGRALRELKRSTSEFTNAMHMDDRPETHYDPPRYDSYGNTYDSTPTSTVSEDDVWKAPGGNAITAGEEPVHGDFVAAAFANDTSEYQSPAPAPAAPAFGPTTAEPAATAPAEIVPRPAESAVPRS